MGDQAAAVFGEGGSEGWGYLVLRPRNSWSRLRERRGHRRRWRRVGYARL